MSSRRELLIVRAFESLREWLPMPVLIVTNDPDDWPFDIANVDLVDAWSYLTDPKFTSMKNAKVFNLCRSYGYQSTGYYVSLLAEARGHKPMPSITTMQDLKLPAMMRLAEEDLDDLIQKTLSPLTSDEFTLSIYFGRNMAHRYDRLSLHLFNQFQTPLIRARFAKREKWQLRSIKTISGSDVPETHRAFVAESASRFFAGKSAAPKQKSQMRFDLAILHDPHEGLNAPSNELALKRFIKAAHSVGLEAQLITKDDYGRLLEFDALFIRETTSVNHHTFRFARRAASEGLVVMDDPQSIVRCSNKVFLAELMKRHDIPTPKSILVHRNNIDRIGRELGFPCVLKKPDGSFARGVVKATSEEDLQAKLAEFLGESEMVVAQEYLPTAFDWRIGVLDRHPLFACRYYMAAGHWQIIQQDRTGEDRYGNFETLPIELAPRRAVQIAVKAANLMGDGFYGVDVKELEGKFYVIEVNDNPNVDGGGEDQVLRDDLYRRVMEVFLKRIEEKKARVYYE